LYPSVIPLFVLLSSTPSSAFLLYIILSLSLSSHFLFILSLLMLITLPNSRIIKSSEATLQNYYTNRHNRNVMVLKLTISFRAYRPIHTDGLRLSQFLGSNRWFLSNVYWYVNSYTATSAFSTDDQ
jgi:sensor histidine kinase YesM